MCVCVCARVCVCACVCACSIVRPTHKDGLCPHCLCQLVRSKRRLKRLLEVQVDRILHVAHRSDALHSPRISTAEDFPVVVACAVAWANKRTNQQDGTRGAEPRERNGRAPHARMSMAMCVHTPSGLERSTRQYTAAHPMYPCAPPPNTPTHAMFVTRCV